MAAAMEGSRSSPLKITVTLMMTALACLGACRPQQPQANVQEPAGQPMQQLPTLPRLESLDRAAILAAVTQAASTHAAGASDSAAQRALAGRQFELRIRFGCKGPSTALREEWLGWSFDEASRTLRVRARPTLAGEDPLVQELVGNAFEAVEGFWIPRPWLLQPVCPAASAVQKAPADEVEGHEVKVDDPLPRAPRIGLARFFSVTDPRTGRRSMRPYEAVKTLAEGTRPGAQGFDLVLSGRLKALPDKRVIACSAEGAQSPPDCIVSAEFDRVWIERPGTEEVIAEWSTG